MIGEFTREYLQEAVQAEQEHDDKLHGKFHNHHEAWGVLKEEVEELKEVTASFHREVDSEIEKLWKLIRKDRVEDFAEEDISWIRGNALSIAKEAIQVVGMCDKWEDLIQGTKEEQTEE